ncbi:hypothetical protein Tco_0960590 [Tanacetum coccineum]
MFSFEKVIVVVVNLVVGYLEREVVKVRVLCKKTCIGVHLSIQRWEYSCECNTGMDIHVLQEDSKEWDNQRDVLEVVEVLLEEETLDEEVAMVDEVFEGAFRALGDDLVIWGRSFGVIMGEVNE